MADLPSLLALPRAALLDHLDGLSAAQRSALYPAVRRVWESDRNVPYDRNWRPRWDGELLWLIRLATAPADQASWPTDPEQSRIVRQRGARFLRALAGHTLRALATDTFGPPVFDDIRARERAGELALPADDQYVLAMIHHVGGHLRSGPSGADLLRGDPDLVERAFWRIFEVEGNKTVSLTNLDRYDGEWHRTVVDLLADHTIDRGRVLDATVAALGRGFSEFRSRWFLRLHETLRPQPPEMTVRQAGYAALLRAPTGPTVALAVNVLSGMEKAGCLDDATVSPGLMAAVHAPAKATAIKALLLADRVAGRLPTAADTVAAALHHPHAEVQATALRLLRRRDDPAGRDAVRAAVASLAPAVAADARAWLGVAAAAYTIDPLVEQPLEPAAPVQPVSPITDPAELAEAFAVLLADPGDSELLERVLGACARLGPDPDRYAGLARRAARLLSDGSAWEFDRLLDVVGRVVLAAAHAPRPSVPLPPLPAALRHPAQRASDAATTLRTGRRYPSCAEPTHAGGWIAPDVLVERMLRKPPDLLDAVAALLRLGPDPVACARRDPALAEAAAAVPGPCGAALRYALGATLSDRIDPADRPLWIAAARARTPQDDDPALLRLCAGFEVPGAGRAPTWRARLEPRPRRPPVIIDATGPMPPTGQPDPALPTLTLAEIHTWTDRVPDTPWYDWLATVWPGNIGPMLVMALDDQGWWLWGRPRVAAPSKGLRLLTRTAADLSPLTALVVAAGLGMATPAQRTAAVDTALALLPRRLTPAALAAAMTTLAPVVPLPRWADSLRDTAAAGCGAQVRAVLTALLPTLDRGTRGLHALLGLLHDEHLRDAIAVTDPKLRAWLATVAGKGAATRSAQALLTL